LLCAVILERSEESLLHPRTVQEHSIAPGAIDG